MAYNNELSEQVRNAVKIVLFWVIGWKTELCSLFPDTNIKFTIDVASLTSFFRMARLELFGLAFNCLILETLSEDEEK